MANAVCDIPDYLPIKYLPSVRSLGSSHDSHEHSLIMLTSVTMSCSQSINALLIRVISFVMAASLTKGQSQFSKTALDLLSTAQGLLNDNPGCSYLLRKQYNTIQYLSCHCTGIYIGMHTLKYAMVMKGGWVFRKYFTVKKLDKVTLVKCSLVQCSVW